MTGQAVVVGASGAVGSVLCRRLVARGMRVVGVARNTEALADLDGVVACPADVTHNDSIEVIRGAVEGPVDLAVIAVGLPVRGSVETIDPDLLAVGANVKLGGTTRLLHAVRDSLVDGSRFVAFAGTLGLEPRAHEAGPGAINAGLINLMKQISLLYGPKGVRVHTVVPGPADTPRLRRIAEAVSSERGVDFDEVWLEYAAHNSLGRLPTVEEIAWAVEMLLEPEAAIMHGSVLHLDAGGLHGMS
ncbi:MAG: SDR family oxidoreductase [Acidimicrobiia bacterium]|nr:SDR family oxidoreductase [Acidimicrobiia bacterium]MDH5293260.1 SDR family oxidoreductase [Acidimicrobiia bacterium]